MTTGFTFGAKTTAAPAFGTSSLTFGAPATSAQPQFGFGTPAATTQSTGLFGSTLFKPPATASTGFNTSAPGFSFGATTAASTVPSFGFGTATTSAVPTLNFTTPATTAPSLGLGGIAPTQTTSALTSTQKELPPKEQSLPNEFIQLVEQFKNQVQEERNRSSAITVSSIKEFRVVETELEAFNQELNQLKNQLLVNRHEADKLKLESVKGLQNVEMAHRTQATPPNLQYENSAPLQFFLDLTDSLERDMQNLKFRIETTEKFVKKHNEHTILTSQDLSNGLQKLHEIFVVLAGQMHTLHNQVESQKEAFLYIRRQYIKDNLNPFEKNKTSEALSIITKNAVRATPSSISSGPTPFNSITLGSSNLNASLGNHAATPPTTASSLFGTPPANSLFQTSSFLAPSTGSNFQLQKPPTGNKRGKQ